MIETRWLALDEVPPDLERPAVWLARNDDPAWADLVAGAIPSAVDLADAALFASPARSAARLARRMLLKALAGRTLDVAGGQVVVERSAAGAIRIAAPRPLHASLSARGGWTMLALADVPVGVDVEAVDRETPPPLDVLTGDERRVLETLPQGERSKAFAANWTIKEAALKAAGVGLNIDPARLSVRPLGRIAEVTMDLKAFAEAEYRDCGPGVAAVALCDKVSVWTSLEPGGV